jgi:predicted metal-binding transcription factor (methanogenesis marker protein 9)
LESGAGRDTIAGMPTIRLSPGRSRVPGRGKSRAGAAAVAVAKIAAPTVAVLRPGSIGDPEPPIAREIPAQIDSKQAIEWLVAAVNAHERLRSKSFYDTGHLIALLLDRRAELGVKDIKELCAKKSLGLSHMTANKYLRVARSFPRSRAIEQGIEKCYALLVYAKAIGRPEQALAILEQDEPIRGSRGLRSKQASAAKIYAAVRALKDAARAGKTPLTQQKEADRAALGAQTLARKLGWRGARAEVVRRGGESKVAIYLSIDTALALERDTPKALARWGATLARTRPALFAPLRAAGWRLGRASASG